MDPLTALSLACNILNIIDFSQKIVSSSYAIYSSNSTVTSENVDLIQATADLQALMSRLDVPSGSPATKDEAALAELAKKCAKLSDDLLTLLRSLEIKQPNSKSESLRVAWRMTRKKAELESLASRIDTYRTQILARITSMMREEQMSVSKDIKDAIHDNHEISGRTLEAVKKTREDLLLAIQDLQRETTQAGVASQVANSRQSRIFRHSETDVASQSSTIEDIRGMLSQILHRMAKISFEEQVLDKLEFREMHHREFAIEREHARTFRWLLHAPSEDDDSLASGISPSGSDFYLGDADRSSEALSQGGDDPSFAQRSSLRPMVGDGNDDNEEQRANNDEQQQDLQGMVSSASKHSSVEDFEAMARSETRTSFLNWLKFGEGIFHVSGKAGSGKSTLMKYFCRQGCMLEELEKWAAGKKLVFAHFFFWAEGSEDQRSIQGLYRAILWQAIRTCPELAMELFPQEAEHSGRLAMPPFEPSVVEAAFELLVKSKRILQDHRLCFFIDGLDEFEGEQWKLVKRLQSWFKTEGIKACVSSRPYNEFEQISSSPSQVLHLHDLTRTDIRKFVKDEFSQDDRFRKISDSNHRYRELMESVVSRAQGVFLWARLVTRDLLHGMANSYSISHLEDHLEMMPIGLHALFKKMFQSIGKLERKRAARSFLLMITLAGSFIERDPLVHSVIDDFSDGSDSIEEMYDGRVGPVMSLEEINYRTRIITQRVNGRCKGLVQFAAVTTLRGPPIYRFEFIHRSVREFLTSEDVSSELEASAEGFDAVISICRACIRLLKGLVHYEKISADSMVSSLVSIINRSVSPMLETCLIWSTAAFCPFISELDAMYRTMQKLPSFFIPPEERAGKQWCPFLVIYWAYSFTEIGVGSTTACSVAPGKLFMSTAAWYGLRQFCMRELSACVALFGTNYPHELLFRASVGARGSYHHSPGCLLVTDLIAAGASPNAIILDPPVSSPHADQDLIVKNGQWTAWTLYLYSSFSSISMIAEHLHQPLPSVSKLMETYIKHDADPTVLFFACIHQVNALPRLCYFDLGQLVEALDPPNKKVIQLLLKEKMYRSPSGLHGWLTSFWGRRETLPTIERIDTEMIRTSKSHILMVLGRGRIADAGALGMAACREQDEERTREILRLEA